MTLSKEPYAGPIVTRELAIELGLKRYTPDKPCLRGHSERYTRTRTCCACQKASYVEWAQSHRKKICEYAARYRTANPQRQKQYDDAKRLEDPEKFRARVRAWRLANPGKYKEKMAVWWAENPDLMRLYARNRRARKKAAEGTHTPEDIHNLFKQQKGRCAYCRASIKSGYHVDHIIALVNGGSNWPRNLQLLCQPCNNQKHVKDPLVFARQIGRLL